MIDVDQNKPEPATYQIQVKGLLDSAWSDWFGGLAIQNLENGITRISGPVDQPALRGVLNKLWDLGLAVLSVQRIEDNSQDGFFNQ